MQTCAVGYMCAALTADEMAVALGAAAQALSVGDLGVCAYAPEVPSWACLWTGLAVRGSLIGSGSPLARCCACNQANKAPGLLRPQGIMLPDASAVPPSMAFFPLSAQVCWLALPNARAPQWSFTAHAAS